MGALTFQEEGSNLSLTFLTSISAFMRAGRWAGAQVESGGGSDVFQGTSLATEAVGAHSAQNSS